MCLQMQLPPLNVHLARLPDDPQHPSRIVLGVVLQNGTHKAGRVFLRGSYSADEFEKLKRDKLVDGWTAMLGVACDHDGTGITLRIGIPMALRDMERTRWPQQIREGEGWRGETEWPVGLPEDAMGMFELGVLKRQPSQYRFGGVLYAEAMSMLGNALGYD